MFEVCPPRIDEVDEFPGESVAILRVAEARRVSLYHLSKRGKKHYIIITTQKDQIINYETDKKHLLPLLKELKEHLPIKGTTKTA